MLKTSPIVNKKNAPQKETHFPFSNLAPISALIFSLILSPSLCPLFGVQIRRPFEKRQTQLPFGLWNEPKFLLHCLASFPDASPVNTFQPRCVIEWNAYFPAIGNVLCQRDSGKPKNDV
jgi:hypothetical protein